MCVHASEERHLLGDQILVQTLKLLQVLCIELEAEHIGVFDDALVRNGFRDLCRGRANGEHGRGGQRLLQASAIVLVEARGSVR